MLRWSMGLKVLSVRFSISKEDGLLSANHLMDDRGLVSSVIYYEEGQALYQDYLNPKGLWQFREYLQDGGRIEVNPIFAFRFQKRLTKIWEN